LPSTSSYGLGAWTTVSAKLIFNRHIRACTTFARTPLTFYISKARIKKDRVLCQFCWMGGGWFIRRSRDV
jgi:hypothetical protein